MKKEALKNRFLHYAASFKNNIDEVDVNVQLKIDHTFRVLEEAQQLSKAENFSEKECRLLECAALLHDLSRFEQFSRFETFNDAVSFNHGEYSYRLAEEQNWIPETFSETEKQTVLTAIRYHNKKLIPENITAEEFKILAALRDADKTDIFKILLEHLKNPENSAIVYKLSDRPCVSEKVAAAISENRSPDTAELKTKLDFNAAKFAWGFDLNYGWTCREFLKREYMQKLRSALPEQPEMLDRCLEQVLKFMQQKGKV